MKTPLERTEAFYRELLAWYGDGDHREIRAASKLLVVALQTLAQHDPHGWEGLVQDYLSMLKHDPERFERLLQANRSHSPATLPGNDGEENLIA